MDRAPARGSISLGMYHRPPPPIRRRVPNSSPQPHKKKKNKKIKKVKKIEKRRTRNKKRKTKRLEGRFEAIKHPCLHIIIAPFLF